MRIIHLSSTDNKGGGARSVYRIHKRMLAEGVDSKMFVRSKSTNDKEVISYKKNSGFLQRLKLKLRRKLKTGGLGYFHSDNSIHNGFSPAVSPYGKTVVKQLPKADIVTLNWVGNFLDYRDIQNLPKKADKLVWRLSDMNPFTGGCYYDNYCGKFRTSCGSCPCIKSEDPYDISSQSLEIKQKVIQSLPKGFLHIIAQSQWIKDEIKSSVVFKNIPVTRIPNGVDTSIFKPSPNNELRDQLKIDKNNIVIAFIAQSLDNPRKGREYFIKTLNALKDKTTAPITVLAIGGSELSAIEGIQILNISNISNNSELASMYSLADIYVISSVQDNLPNTVLEAMACGTPVCGFDIGGIPDVVKHGKSGFLAPLFNIDKLSDFIAQLIEDKSLLSKFSTKSREIIENEFSLDKQFENYMNYYNSLLQHG